MSNLLENKVAIVTGAGSGIGRAIADQYAAEGARVVVSDIDDRAGNETAGRLRDRGAVTWLGSDKASFVTGAYLPIDGGYLAQ